LSIGTAQKTQAAFANERKAAEGPLHYLLGCR
jgi:hypothetical protein